MLQPVVRRQYVAIPSRICTTLVSTPPYERVHGVIRDLGIEIGNRRFVGRDKPLTILRIEVAFVRYACAFHDLYDRRRERGGIEAEYAICISLEKASSAIPGKPRITSHPDKTARGRRCATDIEHSVEHAAHRYCGSGTHRNQERPAAVAEFFARGSFEIGDALMQRLTKPPLGHAICLRAGSNTRAHISMGTTKAGGTGKPSAAIRARLAALEPTSSSGRVCMRPSPIRRMSICASP